MSDAILNAIPVGKSNALPSRQIWWIANVWAESTFQNKLNAMVDVGEIQRREQPMGKGYKYLYWREAST